jgi:hypothetical protein
MIKNFLRIFFVAPCLVSASCAEMNYAVSIKNTGKSSIWVDTFEIHQSEQGKCESGKVGVGALPSCARKSTLHYYKNPHKEVEISWTMEATGLKSTKKVSLDIPKTLWANLIHREIVFNLNPDDKVLEVLYYGYSVKDDMDHYIDSNGNPVNK